MVFVTLPPQRVAGLAAHLASAGILASVAERTRLVTHMDVSHEDLATALRVFAAYLDRP
jgi:threonine aldolase